MDFQELAAKLIVEVGGDSSDKNISGVVEVLKGVMIGVNNQWEQHLAKETNDTLMYDRIVCPTCDGDVEITRTRGYVAIKNA